MAFMSQIIRNALIEFIIIISLGMHFDFDIAGENYICKPLQFVVKLILSGKIIFKG